jgi:hypothetical protein
MFNDPKVQMDEYIVIPWSCPMLETSKKDVATTY